MSFIVWIEMLFGVYTPILTDVYLPIESVDAVTGSVYISSYQVKQVVASNIASLNVVYVLQVLILWWFLAIIMKYMRLALQPQRII